MGLLFLINFSKNNFSIDIFVVMSYNTNEYNSIILIKMEENYEI